MRLLLLGTLVLLGGWWGQIAAHPDQPIEENRFQKFRRNYLITGMGTKISPAYWARQKEHNQVKFQFSVKYYLIGNLWFAYTQKSFWDLWDTERSAPFEDTNYHPEFFFEHEVQGEGILGSFLKKYRYGFDHESNGRDLASGNSRSWNRLFIWSHWGIGEKWLIDLNSWILLDNFFKNLHIVNDELFENADIGEYYGNFELAIWHLFNDDTRLELKLRKGNTKDIEKGSLELGFDFRLPVSWLIDWGFNPRYYAQYFIGYGENMLHYNRFQRKYRLGFMLSY